MRQNHSVVFFWTENKTSSVVQCICHVTLRTWHCSSPRQSYFLTSATWFPSCDNDDLLGCPMFLPCANSNLALFEPSAIVFLDLRDMISELR